MDPMVGKTIDNYKILEVIGRGGMGIVFKAMDESLEKVVALKMIDPVLAHDENFLRRFKREARALARLENANIVTVYALRETSEGLFMVMEYVEGVTIAEWIQEHGAFDWREALKLNEQMADALKHAHSVGVIHRDIKPSNILVTPEGKVKITDFGLAKVVRQHGRESTVTQAMAGTLYYMSPEQVKGLKNVDFRSDIYSLGMTMYEMLVGKRPFEETDSDFSIQKKIVEGDIPSPSKLADNLPKPIVKIIQKSINTAPDKRYQSAEEMLTAMRELEHMDLEEKEKKRFSFDIPLKKVGLPVAGGVVLILLVVLIATGIINIGGFFKSGEKSNLAYLSIETDPPDAAIFFNGDSVGNSPISNYAVKRGEVALRISKSRYSALDTTLNIGEANKSFQFALVPVPQVTSPNVSVQSQPSNASVWLDGQYLGKAPISKYVSPGEYQLKVTTDGYSDYERTLSVNERSNLDITATLSKPEITSGRLAINSRPSGARIYLNNRRSNQTTPHTYSEMEAGRYRISLRLNGYASYDTTVSIRSGDLTTFRANLRQSTGNLKISVVPFGSIYIDGQLVKKDAFVYSNSLSSGKHRIKVVHKTYGEWEKEVSVQAGSNREVQFNFNQEFSVAIASKPPYSKIIVDGQIYKDSDKNAVLTPWTIKIRPGKHTFSVQRDGYTVVDGNKEVQIDQDMVSQPIFFTLQKQ